MLPINSLFYLHPCQLIDWKMSSKYIADIQIWSWTIQTLFILNGNSKASIEIYINDNVYSKSDDGLIIFWTKSGYLSSVEIVLVWAGWGGNFEIFQQWKCILSNYYKLQHIMNKVEKLSFRFVQQIFELFTIN